MENGYQFPKSTPEKQAAINLIFARLDQAKVKETITYGEITDIAHMDIRANRHLLYKAMHVAEKGGKSFVAIRGVGIQRTDPTAAADVVGHYHKNTHRTALRGVRKSDLVGSIESLPPERRTRFLAQASSLGAIAHATRETTLKRMEVSIEKTQKKLPLSETLEAFK